MNQPSDAAGRIDPGDTFKRAVALYQQRKTAQAVALCESVVRSQPNHFDALRLLGSARLQLNQPHEALVALDSALIENPECDELHFNRGNALRELNRCEEAVRAYDRALQLKSNFPEALNNRGTALRSLNRLDEALASYERALELKANYARAWNNRATILRELKRAEEAVADFQRALRLEPSNALTWSNVSTALRDLMRFPEALEAADRALQFNPNFAEAFINRGAAWACLEKPAEALQDYERALELKPAVEVATRARQCRAVVMMKLKRYEDAADGFADVLQLDPRWEYGLGNLLHARRRSCDWTDSAERAASIVQSVLAGERIDHPFQFLSVSDSAQAQLQCARTYGEDRAIPGASPQWRGERYRHDRIRVAYVSPDFREHPVSYLLAGVIENHDPERFEITGISLRPAQQSVMGQRIRRAFPEFIEVAGSSDAEVAALVRQREIDIAVNLMGYTDRVGTIFSRRSAPVQVNFLGYAGTLGTEFHDYIIADELVIPTGSRRHYSERVAYLPHCFQPNDGQRAIAAYTPTRADCGLPESGFVFCCFNGHFKIGPSMFDSWMRLLRQVDGSVLWLADASDSVVRNLGAAAAARGVAPERLVFAPRVPDVAEHLARYRLADLFLDTFPFNAHTTASDALWAGVPVLTRIGEAFSARVAASLLKAVGLAELTTSTQADYEELAIALASDAQRLTRIRRTLTDNRVSAPLFDTRLYTTHLEAAYFRMHERYLAAAPLDHISVGAL
jgi:predicted O-linked N-acetylglucosamine transferase (SPINDLY family)